MKAPSPSLSIFLLSALALNPSGPFPSCRSLGPPFSPLTRRGPAVATGNGYTTVTLKDGVRDVYYARYLDWLITTPLLLVDVLLIAKLPLASAFFAIFCDVAMVITGLFGGVLTEQYRRACPLPDLSVAFFATLL